MEFGKVKAEWKALIEAREPLERGSDLPLGLRPGLAVLASQVAFLVVIVDEGAEGVRADASGLRRFVEAISTETIEPYPAAEFKTKNLVVSDRERGLGGDFSYLLCDRHELELVIQHFPVDLRPDPSPGHVEREGNTTFEDPSPNAVFSSGDGPRDRDAAQNTALEARSGHLGRGEDKLTTLYGGSVWTTRVSVA